MGINKDFLGDTMNKVKKQRVWVILVRTDDGRFATVEGAWGTKAKAVKAMQKFSIEGNDTYYSEDEMSLVELTVN